MRNVIYLLLGLFLFNHAAFSADKQPDDSTQGKGMTKSSTATSDDDC